jgi:hypothetical protein
MSGAALYILVSTREQRGPTLRRGGLRRWADRLGLEVAWPQRVTTAFGTCKYAEF